MIWFLFALLIILGIASGILQGWSEQQGKE